MSAMQCAIAQTKQVDGAMNQFKLRNAFGNILLPREKFKQSLLITS